MNRFALMAMLVIVTLGVTGANCGPPPDRVSMSSAGVPLGGSALVPVRYDRTAASAVPTPICGVTLEFEVSNTDDFFVDPIGFETVGVPGFPTCFHGSGFDFGTNIFTLDVTCSPGGSVPFNTPFGTVEFFADDDAPAGAQAQLIGLSATVTPCGGSPVTVPAGTAILQLN